MWRAGASCLELEPGLFLVELPGTRWTAFVQKGSQTAQKHRRPVGLYFPELALNLSRGLLDRYVNFARN